MTGPILAALMSHWRRRPFQLATLLLGLSLATALWSGVQAINAEARKSYAEAARILGGGGLSEVVRIDGGMIPVKTHAALRRAGWLVSPLVDGWLSAEGGRVRLLGMDPFTMPRDASIATLVEPSLFPELVGKNGMLIANRATAARLPGLGDRLRVVENLAPDMILADITTAQELLDMTGFSRMFLAPDQPLLRPDLASVAPELAIRPPATANDLGRLTDSFHLNLTAFGLLSFAVGLAIVHGSVGLAFEQRRPVLRTLRALGVSSRRIVLCLIFELLTLALAAGALGIIVGYVMAAALLPDVAATLRGLYGATVNDALTLSPLWWLGGVGIACIGTAMSAANGLWRVARMPPLSPARPRAWILASSRAMRWQAIGAATCLAASLCAVTLGGGLVGGFVLVGGFLTAAALLLPMILSSLIAFAARWSTGPIGQWFWADTRQQLPGLSLALMALLLALAANVGVGTMVASFRATFAGWLDQRLVSDLYVTVEDEADIPALMAFLEDRSDAVLPIWHVDAEVMGAPAEIYGVVDHPIYAANWPLLSALPDTWNRIAAGTGALVNEQLARREGLSLEDRLPLPGGWTSTVIGIYSDYGNPLGQVVLPLEALTRHYPDADRSDYGILVPDRSREALTAALTEEFGLPADRITDQGAIKEFSLSVFERTFA
ncbi:MAG: ABC transporter permease, partial [Boseongicola sp. SB0675_bin_26]|nr:ABC transporter permease [Boseongicola sp. SB0675_bin_26]